MNMSPCGCASGMGRCQAYQQMAVALRGATDLDEMLSLARLMDGHLVLALDTPVAEAMDAALNFMLALTSKDGSCVDRARELRCAIDRMLSAVEENNMSGAVLHAKQLRKISEVHHG